MSCFSLIHDFIDVEFVFVVDGVGIA